MNTTVAVDEMAAWIRDEQTTLWSDLDAAIREAINGTWSISASNIAQRIIEAARLVGPTHYDSIPYPLVAGGVYAAVLAAGDVPCEMPDDAEFRRLDELMAKHGVTRDSAIPQYAATVATIRTDRETNWINGGG